MKSKRIIPLLSSFLIAVLFSTNALAQKNFKQDADVAFKSNKFYQSIGMYKKAYAKTSKPAAKAEILFQIAECYRHIDNLPQSVVWYKKAIQAKYPNQISLFWIAEAERSAGKYDDAISYYKQYKATISGDSAQHIQDIIDFCTKAKKWIDNPPTRYVIKAMPLINSQQFDFSPTFADKRMSSLIFTSTRVGSTGGAVSDVTGQSYADLYITKQDRSGKWSEPVRIQGPVNTQYAEGAACMGPKMRNLYYTQCKYGKTGKYGCQILVAPKMGQNFGQPKVIPLASDTIVVGHPAISPDGQTMVFASNLPGGFGGKDLWYSTYSRRSRSWSKPVNLGSSINTKGDEMFPYIRSNGDLYFASNGWPGMGGLDIFVAKKQGKDKWGNVQNMKYPINSPQNDYGIIFNGNKDEGYLTSNRDGGRGGDDIWSFKMKPLLFVLQATVTNGKTHEAIAGADVKLIGSDGSVAEQTTDATGQVKFEQNGTARYINPNTSYSILVTKKKFLNAKGKLTTVGVKQSTIFNQKYELLPITGPIELPEIVFQYDKANITPQAADSLNYLYKILIDNPHIVIQLRANTDYRGSNKYNQALSQRRADSSVAYLVQKGIDPARMVAKGEGENVPRTLEHAIGPFKKGQVLTEKFVKSLIKNKTEYDLANKLNRRTEFSVLRTDYQPKAKPSSSTDKTTTTK